MVWQRLFLSKCLDTKITFQLFFSSLSPYMGRQITFLRKCLDTKITFKLFFSHVSLYMGREIIYFFEKMPWYKNCTWKVFLQYDLFYDYSIDYDKQSPHHTNHIKGSHKRNSESWEFFPTGGVYPDHNLLTDFLKILKSALKHIMKT